MIPVLLCATTIIRGTSFSVSFHVAGLTGPPVNDYKSRAVVLTESQLYKRFA
jgi:hypothetical protein